MTARSIRRNSSAYLPTDRQQVPARVKLLLYVNNSLFTLNSNCLNLDFGTPTHPFTLRTSANYANSGDEQVGSITCSASMKRRRSASGRLKETIKWCSTIGVVMVTLISITFVAPLVTLAQPPGDVHRIGWLSSGFPRPDRDPSVDAFRQGLRDL